MNRHKFNSTQFALLLISPLIASPALSQSSVESSAGALEEVIVTATKRAANLQDVPVSVGVVRGDFLEELRLQNVADLTQFVPNLSWQDGRESKARGFNIRGIGTATFNDGVEDSVGVVVDGVPLARAAMGLYDMYDIEMVEVLRGPQGTTFGKSASAGVVSFTTNNPNPDEFQAEVTASYGDMDLNEETKISGFVTGPITDELAYRFTGFRNDRGGIVRDYFRDTDDWSREQFGGRAKLLWTPNDDLTAVLSVDYLKEENECCAEIPMEITNPNGRMARLVAPLLPNPIDDENRSIAQDGRMYSWNKVGGILLRFDWEFAGHTLTSLSAFRSWETFKSRRQNTRQFFLL